MQTLLSPDQSRAARRELALSQKDVIAQTGIAAYKLKQFESGSFRPDLATLKTLRDFYEGQGVNFDELNAYLRGGRDDGQQGLPDEAIAAQRKAGQIKPGLTLEPRPGFFISTDLPGGVVDKLQTDMEESDDRIGEIVNGAIFDSDNEEMVIVRDIELYSMCEHHLLPFEGTADVTYAPDRHIAGLSRIVQIGRAHV